MAGDLLGHLEWLTPYRLFTCSWVFRLVLILYGEVHDRLMDVKFTDIDYRVFSDAASHVLNGSSPYERHTYRYTPLLAWLLVPNHILLYSFGKLVFITLDVLAGGVMYKMLRLQKMPERSAVLSCLLWLANPLTAVVSSRGNAESIMAFLILSCLFLLMRGKVSSSAVLYGLAVHTKIYPIIYCVPLMLNIGPTPWVRATPTGLVIKWHLFVTPSRLKFAFISFATFLVTSSVCYLMYGWQYLHEALLYHVTRTDIRHNFSVYFYMLYLTQGTWVGPFISLLTFFPQFLLVIMGGVKYHRDLPFCFFVQTFLFVTFNKVCTSQVISVCCHGDIYFAYFRSHSNACSWYIFFI